MKVLTDFEYLDSLDSPSSESGLRKSPWENVRIGDITEIIGGNGFPERLQGQKNGEIPFIKVSDMSEPLNVKFIHCSNNFVSSEVVQTMRWTLFPPQTVVFAKVGAALLLNKRRILTRPTVIDNNMMGVTPSERIDPEFLFQFLTTIDFGLSVQPGAIPSINQSIVARLPISLPPLDEQSRIATVLATVDEAIAATDAVIAQLGEYREAILLAAFNQTLAGDQSGDAVEWQTIRLGDCGDWFGGLTPSMKVSRYWEGGSLPWITPKDMRRPVIADSEDHVNQSAVDDTGLRIAPPGSVVFVVRGMILAKRFPVAITTVPSTINQDMRAIVANEKVDGYFLLLALQKWSDKILSLVKTATHGTKKLDSPELKELSISIPPLPEQRRIAAILSAFDDRLALERAERERLVALKKGLMQVLLTGKVRVPPGIAEEVAPAHA